MLRYISTIFESKNRTECVQWLHSFVLLLILSVIIILTSSCSPAETEADPMEDHKTGCMDIRYATQFEVNYYDDDVSMISVGDGLKYLLVPDTENLPEWLSEADISGYTIIRNNPPINAAAGIVMRASSPTNARAIWGITHPTQPTFPLIETQFAVKRVEQAILIRRGGL